MVWFSHPKSEWSMGIGVGKLIQQVTRENHQNLNEEQKSTSGCFDKKMLLSIWTIPRIACLEVAMTMKSNQLLCGRGIPCKDEGFERENSLTPILLTIIFYKLAYIETMAWGC